MRTINGPKPNVVTRTNAPAQALQTTIAPQTSVPPSVPPTGAPTTNANVYEQQRKGNDDGGPALGATLHSNGKQLTALQFKSAQSPAMIERAVRKLVPELSTTTPAPVPHDVQWKKVDAQTLTQARATLNVDRLMKHPGLSNAQRERLVDMLATVKVGFDRAGAHLADLGVKGEPGLQDINWKHTHLEMDRVLDAALAHKLSPQQTEDALFASMFSDSVKAGSNFITHNVHGANAALRVLSGRVPSLPQQRLHDIVRCTLEHQIGPPKFMAMMAAMFLKNSGAAPDVIASIQKKLASPLDAAHQTADGTQLSFSADERAALKKIGVEAWTVPPRGARHEKVSRAVIEADSMVNYACPDGWAKLIGLHGPQTMFDKDTLLADAVTKTGPGAASAQTSFDDARSVVSDDALAVYDAGHARASAAWQRTLTTLRKEFGEDAPFLDAPLTTGDAQQTATAIKVRVRAIELMRAEESA